MTGVHRIFGSELSPYSIKVRSYFRYKRIPHEWLVRDPAHVAEFQRHAKLPLVPLVVTPEGQALQDSTPILEHFEALHPEPSIHPPDPTLSFLSALLEEYGDEWGNKPMFHYRWTYEADRRSAAERILRENMPALAGDAFEQACAGLCQRMVPRLRFVGSNPETLPVIEGSYERQLALLEAHLAERAYLFGGRPAFGDFGLAAQLRQCASDPTPGRRMRERAPRVLAWCERMLDPKAEGAFERWESLGATLLPLLRDEVGALFLPWSDANARALAAGQKEFALQLGGRRFAQETQKYHAKSLAALRARHAAVTNRSGLDTILEASGCLRWLRTGT